MKRPAFMLFHAIVALAFGVAFVAAPLRSMALYGMTLDPSGIFLTRLLGAAFIQVGLVSWLARADSDTSALRAILRGYTGGAAVGLIIMTLGTISGVTNSLGWVSVVLYLAFAVGYGYFAAQSKEASVPV